MAFFLILLICTVICHFWYIWLDQRLPGRAFKTVMKKLAVDQVFFSPLLITVFFGTVGVLENMRLEVVQVQQMQVANYCSDLICTYFSSTEVIDEIKSKAWRLYAAEWIVWPPAQLLNFYLLPTRFRVLYDNTISLGFDVYTSYVKHDKG